MGMKQMSYNAVRKANKLVQICSVLQWGHTGSYGSIKKQCWRNILEVFPQKNEISGMRKNYQEKEEREECSRAMYEGVEARENVKAWLGLSNGKK